MNSEDLKYNYGCVSCGYKLITKASPKGRIDVRRFIDKLDEFFDKNDMAGAGNHLTYWRQEAASLGDLSGELTVVSEQIGYFRKTLDERNATEAISRGFSLIEALQNSDTVSAATVFLNSATTLKAFGKAAEAVGLYEKALSIYKRELPEDDTRFGGLYNNYGLALVDLCEYEKAEELYKKAIEIMLKSEKGKCDAAITFINMAYLYNSDSRWGILDIEKCLTEAKRLLGDEKNIKNGYYAFVLSKCAPAFRDFCDEETAKIMEDEAKRIYEGA